MEKRIFVAIAISIAFLWLWAAVAPRIFPELAPPKPPVERTATQATAPATGTTASEPTATTESVEPEPVLSPSQEPVTPVVASGVEETVVEAPDYIARFTNRGAQLVSFQLKNYKLRNGSNVELVKARPPSSLDYPFAIVARQGAIARRLNSALYAVQEHEERGTRVIEYRYTGPDGVGASKTFRVTPDFVIEFSIEVRPAIAYRTVIGPGIQNLDPKASESQAALLAGNAVIQQEGDLEVLNREGGDRFRFYESVEFVGVEDNYFMVGFKPG
ncbi:MAG TPA: membrane protein insertase YidC, partial [Thermoanaerobaculia bacterium]|nr:membrane protein insertase YidC [Thermoanaerobaculia bacterium]